MMLQPTRGVSVCVCVCVCVCARARGYVCVCVLCETFCKSHLYLTLKSQQEL